MQRDEFVKRVVETGELGGREEAERAIKATFGTLRERCAGNEPNNLASQIPGNLAHPLQGAGGREGHHFGRPVGQIGAREILENVNSHR